MDLVSSSSIQQRKYMLTYLGNTINDHNVSENTKATYFDQYIGHKSSFISDDMLRDTIIAEVTSMGILAKKNSNKVATQWLSQDNRDYCFSESQRFKHAPKPISEYPGITKLLEVVNADPSTTQNLDSALVMGYNTSGSCLNFHDDSEKLIDQSASIAVVSFGSERRMEFCYQGGPKSPQFSINVKEGDMVIMKPGCQQALEHRICPGSKSQSTSWRFSISFRKVSEPSEDNEISFNTVPDADGGTVKSEPKPKTKARISIITGDSLVAELDPIKLGRNNRKIVRNLSKGGALIRDVSNQIDKFYTSVNDDEVIVENVFVCVGTNDIRYCKESGVGHLRRHLFGLINKIKLFFPGAKIWFQSLIPLLIQNQWTISNIESYNSMLYDVCSISKIFYINCFHMFLARTRRGDLLRDERLFIKDNIHPNKSGVSKIALKYLFCIHNSRFNPLAY